MAGAGNIPNDPSLELTELERRIVHLGDELAKLGVDTGTLLDQAEGSVPLTAKTGYVDLHRLLGPEAALAIFSYLQGSLTGKEVDLDALPKGPAPAIPVGAAALGLNAGDIARYIVAQQDTILATIKSEMLKLGGSPEQVESLLKTMSDSVQADLITQAENAKAASKAAPKAEPEPATPEAIQAEAKKKLKELEQGFEAKLKESGLEMPKDPERSPAKPAQQQQQGPSSPEEIQKAGKQAQQDLQKGIDEHLKQMGYDTWPGMEAPKT